MGGGGGNMPQSMTRKSSKNLLGDNPNENGLNPINEEIELRENDGGGLKSKMSVSKQHLLASGSGLMSPSDILNISDSDHNNQDDSSRPINAKGRKNNIQAAGAATGALSTKNNQGGQTGTAAGDKKGGANSASSITQQVEEQAAAGASSKSKKKNAGGASDQDKSESSGKKSSTERRKK